MYTYDNSVTVKFMKKAMPKIPSSCASCFTFWKLKLLQSPPPFSLEKSKGGMKEAMMKTMARTTHQKVRQ